MINVEELTEEDVGRKVLYKPFYFRDDPSRWEVGTLSSFRDNGRVFVKFKGPTGEACNAMDLFWEND